MPKEIAVSTHLIHQTNCSSVLNFLRTSSPTSRSAIARQLDISLPTVMRIIDNFITDGWVRETGLKQPSGGGRPRSLIEINYPDNLVISADLGYPNMYATFSDFDGNVLGEQSTPIQPQDGQENLSRLMSLIGNFLSQSRLTHQRIRGIGLGIPGSIDSQQGMIVQTPHLGWQNYPLARILTDEFSIPVFLEKDINLTALGEFGYGVARNSPNMVVIAIGTGIGSGIILNGELYRGNCFNAGNIGDLVPGVQFIRKNGPRMPTLEKVASGTALVERTSLYLEQHHLPLHPVRLTAEEVFRAANQDTNWAIRFIGEIADYLSLTIAAISVLLDPETIVLGGRLAGSLDILVEPIQENLRDRLPSLPDILVSNLGSRATMMGTVMLVINQA